jgi:hypothetical protein
MKEEYSRLMREEEVKEVQEVEEEKKKEKIRNRDGRRRAS